MSDGGVLIVSNRLPINLVKQADGRIAPERSIGGVATALDSVAKYAGARWVGWTGYERVLNHDELAAARLHQRFVPVQADADLMSGYYDRFSTRYLWPVLHGKEPSYTPTESDWAAYQAMNRRFAETVQRTVHPDDVIWVQDFHLMLLPQYLQELGVTNRIGYFLHVQFPEPKHWQRMPYVQELTKGVAHAHLIGMQRSYDAKHFSQYAAQAGIAVRGRVQVFPIGVDYAAYHEAAKRRTVQQFQRTARSQFADRQVIFSLSRMDYTKGILTQLEVIEHFLSGRADRQDFVYKLIVAPSREHLPEYTKLSKDIEQMVARINQQLGQGDWQPVEYEHRTIGFEESVAWYGVADVLMLLPDADGMNLIAKEYVAARQDDLGMSILSTSIGAAEQLRQALLVPPRNVPAAVDALNHAFTMSTAERTKRWAALRQAAQAEDLFWWTDTFLAALSATKK